MTEPRGGPARSRQAAAAGLSVALLLAGVLLSLVGKDLASDREVPVGVWVAVLLAVYVLPHLYTVDIEFRRESYSVTVVHLPLAIGVLVVAPVAHLAVRLVAALVSSAIQRQAPQKVVYNLGAAAIEVGAAVAAVSLVADREGPAVWLALYAGLVAGEVIGMVVLNAIWRLVGTPVSISTSARVLLHTAPLTLLFTMLAIVAITAVQVEPLSGLVMLVLAGWLGLAYRTHRRLVVQQTTTEQLYAFVKDLGPLTVESAAAPGSLERVRTLLHAERLELATPTGSSPAEQKWCRLVVAEGRPPERSDDGMQALSSHVAATRAPTLSGRQRGGEDTIATPLLTASGLIGILTATQRLGSTRGFEPGDLHMLETVGAELSIALERGRLQLDLERGAKTDPLTGLDNLPEVTRRLAALLHRCPEGMVLAAVAVDSFREVNDTLGHQAGDELLLEVTRRLLLCSPGALIGRIGGGRFAVAVPAGQAGGDPEMFGLSLRANVEGSAQIGPVGTHVPLSVGVVRAPEHGADGATLIRRAETAMYSARHVHGGPVVWEPAYEVQGSAGWPS